jgi:adenylate kinase
MQQKTYTEAELVSFGNYMLNQDKRRRKTQIRNRVDDTDLDKWKASKESE